MASATYSHSSLLGGFNSTTGVFTNVYNTFQFNTTINDDYSPPADGNDTLSVSDGVIGLNSETYSGYTYNGFPVIIRGVNYKVYHNGEITDSGTGGTATPVAEYPLCYLIGTHIATPHGAIPVEQLQVGDEVITHTGATAKVRFNFIQKYHNHFFLNKEDTYPICIKAGALADNVPSSDLYVSPDHAIYFPEWNFFVEASILAVIVNDTSIYPVQHMPEIFTYHHILCDNQEIVLAENTPAETFIDNVSMETFDNYAEYAVMYPEDHFMEELDIPRARSMRPLPRAFKQNLLDRAQQFYPVAQAA